MEITNNIDIYDVVLYNGENDILRLRNGILQDHITEYVLTESALTFSGISKARNTLPPIPKIHHVYIDIDFTEDSDILKELELTDLANEMPWWKREYYQREYAKRIILDKAKPDDIIFISDIDEIWDPQVLKNYQGGIKKLQQQCYAYHLDWETTEYWAHAFVCQAKELSTVSINAIRKSLEYDIITDAGWHFTSMGGPAEFERKIQSFSHQELNTDHAKAIMRANIQNGMDMLGRPEIKITRNEEKWPQFLKDNREEFKHLCST